MIRCDSISDCRSWEIKNRHNIITLATSCSCSTSANDVELRQKLDYTDKTESVSCLRISTSLPATSHAVVGMMLERRTINIHWSVNGWLW